MTPLLNSGSDALLNKRLKLRG